MYIFRIAHRFNVAEGTFSKLKKEILEIIVEHLYSDYVKWPSTAELENVAERMTLNRK